MIKVCLFNSKELDDFHGYKIETFDPLAYFDKSSHWSLYELLTCGLNGYFHRRSIQYSAEAVDRLYREKNPNYMRMASDFVDRFRDFDLIVMSTYNFLHPEILHRELKKPIKVLGLIDDPMSTYLRGLPYLWAFDGVFYVSPGYMDNLTFDKAIQRWGDKNTYWWPLVPFKFAKPVCEANSFFYEREFDLVYVGLPNTSKMERLIKLKRHFGERMRIHGRWPFWGLLGFVHGILGKPIFPYRVQGISADNRTKLYWKTKIGFNMHVSDFLGETGNLRMYETPAHGMMQVCDKASADAHNLVFADQKEAIYYDDIDDAIEKIEYYLCHSEERVAIAKAGYEKFWRNYECEYLLKKFLNWAISLKSLKAAV